MCTKCIQIYFYSFTSVSCMRRIKTWLLSFVENITFNTKYVYLQFFNDFNLSQEFKSKY